MHIIFSFRAFCCCPLQAESARVWRNKVTLYVRIVTIKRYIHGKLNMKAKNYQANIFCKFFKQILWALIAAV